MHCKKWTLPSPAGMSLAKLFWLGVFPARESLVSDIPAEDRKIAKLFLQCRLFTGNVGLFLDTVPGARR
jgi:hypothetical protein